jgi:hypothetical protein
MFFYAVSDFDGEIVPANINTPGERQLSRANVLIVSAIA